VIHRWLEIKLDSELGKSIHIEIIHSINDKMVCRCREDYFDANSTQYCLMEDGCQSTIWHEIGRYEDDTFASLIYTVFVNFLESEEFFEWILINYPCVDPLEGDFIIFLIEKFCILSTSIYIGLYKRFYSTFDENALHADDEIVPESRGFMEIHASEKCSTFIDYEHFSMRSREEITEEKYLYSRLF